MLAFARGLDGEKPRPRRATGSLSAYASIGDEVPQEDPVRRELHSGKASISRCTCFLYFLLWHTHSFVHAL